MKKIILFVFLFITIKSFGQTYNPSNATVSNKSYAPAQAVTTDFRSQFYDATNFVMRDYASVNEVWSYLNLPKYRTGHFPIYVHFGGILGGNGVWAAGSTLVYWFKDSTGNANLVRWYTDSSTAACPGCLLAANNLSDLSNATTARGNLGLGGMAILNTTAGGDLSGTFPNPTVARFNGQLPSFYTNYLNLTNVPAIPPQLNPTGVGLLSITGTYPNLTFNARTPGFEETLFQSNATSRTDSINIGAFIFRMYGTSAFGLPTGTTAQRPSSPAAGDTRWNTDSLKKETYNGSAWVTDGTGGGGGSGITALTGDGTASGTGSVPFTLATVNTNVFGSNTFLKFGVNGKGLITSATAVVNSDIVTALGFTPYNATNPAGYIPLTALSASAPLSYNSGTGAFTIQAGGTSQNGYISSTDWNTFNGKLTSTLTSGNMFVGNGSNVATSVTPSGAWTITNAGVSTLTANSVATSNIQNNAVTLGKEATGPPNYLRGWDGSGNPVALQPDTLFQVTRRAASGVQVQMGNLSNDTLYLNNLVAGTNITLTKNSDSTITIAAAGGASGITTLNTLTAATQTFATGTSGSDFNISSVTSTHTFNLPSSSAANRGLLTSTDWSTFNSKLSDPLTTNGDIIARISGSTTRLAQGSNGQFLGVQSGALGYFIPNVLYQFNVKDYGALGDGVTNDITAINSCFTAAMAYPFQATIVFPAGIYLINGALVNITRAVLIQGINATIKSSVSTAYNMMNVASDSVRLYGLKFLGNTQGQTGININGFKYFDLQSCEFTSLARGVRFANTSSTFNAGNVNLCNFYSNLIGVFSDTLGEYVTVSNCLLKSNTVAVQNDGGNNLYPNDQANNNTTAYKFTGGSNNAHGSIIGGNANHNGTSIDANGCNFGETIVGWHAYEGHMLFVNCSNWMFEGGSILSPDSLQIWNCANMDFSKASFFTTYSPKYSFVGNLNRPKFNENFGDVAGSITTPYGSVTPLLDSIGGYGYRVPLTSDTFDLGIARWQYKSLSVDDTIKKIIHPTVGRTYRLEVTANGHNFVLFDNAKINGTFNSSATLNVYTLECIDDGADPRFIVNVSQPGVMVARNTNNVGWGRVTGTGTISNNNLTKTGPDGTAFTVWAFPDKILSGGDGYYVAQAASTNANIIWGLSTTVVQNSYNTINYAIYFFSTSGAANNVNIAENGTIISAGLGGTNWATGDSFRVKRTGTTITYEKFSGGTWNVFYTSLTASSVSPLIPQVAIRALTTFTNPRIYGTGVTNNLQSYFAVGYTGNIDAFQSGGTFTIGTFSNTATAKGLDFTSSVLTAHAADGSNAGMLKASGSQTIGPVLTMPAPIFTGMTSAGANDSIPTIDPATGQMHWRSGALNLHPANGITGVSPDSLLGFTGALNQTSSVSGAGFAMSLGTTGSRLGGFSVWSTGGSAITGGIYASTGGSQLLLGASTINNAVTSTSGSVSDFSAYYFRSPTITSTNTGITYSHPTTLRIEGGPTMSTNSTNSNQIYALDVVAGISHFGVGGGVSAWFDGVIGINGSTPNNTIGISIGASTTTVVPFNLSPGVDVTGGLLTQSGNLWYNGTNLYFVDGSSTGVARDLLAGVKNYTHSIFAPTTGGTVSLVVNKYNIINPAGTLATLTVNLPSSPANNDVVYIKYTQTVSAVTYANGTVVDPITGPVAGGVVILVYDAGTTSWY